MTEVDCGKLRQIAPAKNKEFCGAAEGGKLCRSNRLAIQNAEG
jgi:hypothetical protein